MTILRLIAAILIGYVVYAFASMTLVGAIMGSEGAGTTVVALVALVAIGAAAGAIVALIAGSKGRLAGAVTAGLVVLATAANLLMQLGAEPLWYKVGTLLLTAPALFLVARRISAR